MAINVCCIVFVAIMSSIFIGGFVDCRRIDETLDNNTLIKTIQGDDGYVIDCVDINKQPALIHPLLKDHTIQMKPSVYPSGTGGPIEDELFQDWSRSGECPEGTIPIGRGLGFDDLPLSKSSPEFKPNGVEVSSSSGHEYAQVTLTGGGYYGGFAALNVWNPATLSNETSISQMWIVGGDGNAMSTLEVGWIVKGTDKRPGLFIYWTGDGYQKTGCYNLDCPGFVQISNKIALGSPLQPVSSYNNVKQYDVSILIFKDQSTGDWWLKVQNEVLGYWPHTIVPSLSGSAGFVSWGGEIFNSEPGGRHTTTQMGSGHFPNEGFDRASYVRNIQYVDRSHTFVNAEGLVAYATKPSCYNVNIDDKLNPQMGTHFYFGGPGYSPTCPK